MIIGLLCALGAALAYGVASILQSVAITKAGASGGDASALVRVRTQPLYFVGLGLDGMGFVGVVVALQFLPLFLVQSVVAASVGVTAAIAAVMGARLGRSGWIALAAAGVGLVLLSVSAASDDGRPLSMGWRWVLLVLAGAIGVAALVGGKWSARLSASVLALGAGLGFSVVAVASRSLDLPHPVWKVVADPGLWAILIGGGVSILLFALALQAGSVTSVLAVTFTTETVLPAGIGLAFLGDAVRSGFTLVAAAGFVLAVLGAIALARFAEGIPHPELVADPVGSIEGPAS